MKRVKTIGMDLGDKNHHVCVLDAGGKVEMRGTIRNEPDAVRGFFLENRKAKVVMETGMHSGWVTDIGREVGMSLVVANSREVASIWKSRNKSDERDAEQLARLARADEKLLKPVQVRGREVRRDMVALKAREALVRSRVTLVNQIRSICKNFGYRLASGGSEAFGRRVRLPEELQELLDPMLKQVESLSECIKGYDEKIIGLEGKYPVAKRLQQVTGVGSLTSVAYVLMVEDPGKFKSSRDAGAYFGLKPRRDQSGEIDKQLPISKLGSEMVRRLLVNASQYIMGRFGPDSDLRRFGMKLAARGGKAAKKRAVIAVARKLAVLLHALWKSGQDYQPLKNGGLLRAA
jgi:transposase